MIMIILRVLFFNQVFIFYLFLFLIQFKLDPSKSFDTKMVLIHLHAKRNSNRFLLQLKCLHVLECDQEAELIDSSILVKAPSRVIHYWLTVFRPTCFVTVTPVHCIYKGDTQFSTLNVKFSDMV